MKTHLSRASGSLLKLAIVLISVAVGCKGGGDKREPAPVSPPAEPVATPAASIEAPAHAMATATGAAATVWARIPGADRLEVEVEGAAVLRIENAPLAAARDHAAAVALAAPLEPGKSYRYHWRGVRDGDRVVAKGEGRFTVPPAAADPAPVRFAYSGDLGGQNACRDVGQGYPIFEVIGARDVNFFIGLGDMIYADGECLATGRYGNQQVPGIGRPARELDEIRSKWRYNRADARFRALLAAVTYYWVWDDHEIENDFGPRQNSGIFDVGLRAFLDYHPVVDPERLYYSVRWGKHLELFFLDTRRYRSPNREADTEAAAKTLLGAEQRDWLLSGLAASDAPWKLIVSSVPLSIPTGSTESGRDGFANHGSDTGFEREASAILGAMAERRLTGVVFITTDVHFATGFRYRPMPEYPDFIIHEFVVGPLAAGFYPNRKLDPTLRPERLFFHAPDSPDDLTWEQSLDFNTFGEISIAATGDLEFDLVDARGKSVFKTKLASPPVKKR